MHDGFLEVAAASLLVTLAAMLAVGGLAARLGFPVPDAAKRIGMVDGLRGYLASLVFIHHFHIVLRMICFGEPWQSPPVRFYNQIGMAGVAFFFMITGLVFYPRIVAGIQGTNWPKLYRRRAFRILPLSLFAVTMVCAIAFAGTGNRPDSAFWKAVPQWLVGFRPPDLLGYPDTFTINGWVMWSLWYEWLFYIGLLPFCAVVSTMLRDRRKVWLIPCALIVAGFVGRQLSGNAWFTYLPAFAVGMLAFELSALARVKGLLERPLTAAICLALLVLVLVFGNRPYGAWLAVYGFIFVTVVVGNRYFGLLSNRGAIVLGEISFSIYMLHAIVLHLLDAPLRAWAMADPVRLVMAMPLVGIVVVCVSCASYFLIERPGIRLGRWIENSSREWRLQERVAP